MSLLNDASLILTPNAVKEGKLYSIIPTNGNGDMTVVRATGATRTNELGLIEFTPYNLFVRSDEFENSSWVKQLTSVTVNSTISPNGLMNADTVTSTTTGQARVEQSLAVPTINTTYTFSTYAKASSSPFVALTRFSGIFVAIFNLSSGTIVNQTAGVNATIISVGNGWYRISITVNALTTDSNSVWKIHPCTSTDAFSSVVGNSIFLWGAQLVQGSIPKDYFYTTDRLNVPRLNYDSVGGCPSILVEPQRTNQLIFCSDLSNSIWLKTNYALSSVASIQGLTTTRITKNSTNNGLYNGTGARSVIHNLGTSAAAIKTFSCLIRKGNTNKVGLLINNVLVGALTVITTDFNFTTKTFSNTSAGLTVSYENLTTDIYKFILTFNDTSASTLKAIWIAPIDNSNNTVTDGYLDIAYFQLEEGSYSTSFIPTTTAIVTRNADVITRNNIYTNNLITSLGGAWFIELNNNLPTNRDAAGNLYIGTDSQSAVVGSSLNIRHNTANVVINKCINGTLTQLSVTGINNKILFSWNGTSAKLFRNGVVVISSTAFNVTNMEFFKADGLDVPKYIKSMMLFPKPLTDAECIALTTL